MGLKACQITLDNPWNTYYPGQTINGQVEFTFDAPKKVRGISIRFKGAAETSWSESTKVKDAEGRLRDTTNTFTGNEEYFTISYYLVGSKSGSEMELPAGKHQYPFTCALPPTLPSSFEGEHGYVRYTIKVTLDRPWKFDQDTKMAFTVVSHLDLNLNPEYRLPIELHMEKSFCCCWCKSGPLIVDMATPVRGYCSGQTIPLEISCENGSNVTINYIKIILRKVVVFRAQTPSSTREEKIVISEITLDPTPGHSSRNWQELIEIPPLPPSNLTNCSLIDLDYELKVICNPSGAHMKIELSHPIILGTVPIVGFNPPPITDKPVSGDTIIQPMPDESPLLPPGSPSYPMQPADNPYAMQPGLNPQPGMPEGMYPPAVVPQPSAPVIEPNVLYPTLAQPIFREGQFAARSIHDGHDNQHTAISGRENFAPMYPTYGFKMP